METEANRIPPNPMESRGTLQNPTESQGVYGATRSSRNLAQYRRRCWNAMESLAGLGLWLPTESFGGPLGAFDNPPLADIVNM